MTKKIISVYLLTLFTLAHSHFDYNGGPLTPENLYANAPKMNGDDEYNFRMLLQKHHHVITRLLSNPEAWSEAHFRNSQMIKFLKNFLNGLGHSNYVFSFEKDEKYPVSFEPVVKISGHVHRLWNLSRGKLGEPSGFYGLARGTLTEEEVCAIETTEKTYQTASRIAYYLLINQFIKQNNIENIVLPETYLVTFDGSSDVSDTNAIVVESKLKELQPLEDVLKESKLTEEAIHNFAALITECALWSIKGNVFIKDGKILILLDLEQPNKACPHAAFLRNSNRGFNDDQQWDTMTGLREFYEILKEADQHKVLQEWVKSGKHADYLKSFGRYNHLVKVLELEN